MSEINAQGWIRFLDRCAAGGTQLHSLVAHRRGRRIVRGQGDPWAEDDLHLIYSMSKTFCSAAAGLAVADGAFGYDDLIVDLFPDQVDDRVGPKARTITVRHLLSMSSGHSEEMIGHVMEATDGLLRRDSIGAFLRFEPDGTPGETFAYNQPCTWTVSRVVAERTGATVEEIIQQRVLAKLGITRSVWAKDADGVPLGFSGFHVTGDTLGAFAQLLLDGGVHDGEQLLAPEWVENYHRAWVKTENPFEPGKPDWNLGYGWQVWMGQHGWRGDGAFGQYGVVVPEHELSVGIQSWTPDMQLVLSALWEEVLLGLDDAEDDPADLAALEERLANLTAMPTPETDPAPWQGTVDGLPFDLGGSGDTWTARWGLLDEPLAVGVGRWSRTVITDGSRSLEVAGRLIEGDLGPEVALAVVNTPHTLRITLPAGGGVGSTRWTPEGLHPLTLHGLMQDFPR